MIDINFHPDSRQLRFFCVLLIPFSVVLGWLVRDQWGAQSLGWTLNGCFAAVGLVGLWIPASARWLFVGWTLVTFPIGWMVSHLILAALYFGLFFPLGWVARWFGYDPLQLRPSESETYWNGMRLDSEKGRYFRQF